MAEYMAGAWQAQSTLLITTLASMTGSAEQPVLNLLLRQQWGNEHSG